MDNFKNYIRDSFILFLLSLSAFPELKNGFLILVMLISIVISFWINWRSD